MDKTKQDLNILLQTSQIIVPSYLHYGGVAGFHDYGIVGLRIKNNLLNHWRKTFLFEDEIEEIETPTIMPFDLLKSSGHVDKFTDYVVYDAEDKCYRADHLVEEYFIREGMYDLAKLVDSFNAETLEKYINEYNMIEKPVILEKEQPVKVQQKNLMFELPNEKDKSEFMRPELAQGIFVNFSQYNKSLPFGISQIGKSYRKEISPQPFTRMREFTQAEIEYFVDPINKDHPKYDKVKDTKIILLSSDFQEKGLPSMMISVSDAINQKIISNQTIGYYLAKIHKFALDIGLNPEKIRFRQHFPDEMAHYANECWDLECLVFGNWLECVGCADRGDYDLKTHSQIKDMAMKKELDEPKKVIKNITKINKALVGKTFKDDSSKILDFLETIGDEDRKELVEKQEIDLDGLKITKDMVNFMEIEILERFEEFYPHTIEPSFGIDRLLYAVFVQNFWMRDETKPVISLPNILSPYDVAIFHLHNKEAMMKITEDIKLMLMEKGLSCYSDNSNTKIGKRYVRTDIIGINKVITVDPGTIEDKKVTVRDRDTMQQDRIPIENLFDSL